MKKLLSISDLFENTWDLFKKNFWELVKIIGLGWAVRIGIVLLGAILLVSLVVLSSFNWSSLTLQKTNLQQIMSIIIALGPLVVVLAVFVLGLILTSLWVNLGLIIQLVNSKSGANFASSLKQSFKKLWSFVWISFLVNVIVGLGFVLFIIPGIVFAIWYLFAIYVFADKGTRGWSALKKSKQLVQGRWWPIFGRVVLLFVLIMICSIALSRLLPILSIVFSFLFGLFFLCYYFNLYKNLIAIKEYE